MTGGHICYCTDDNGTYNGLDYVNGQCRCEWAYLIKNSKGEGEKKERKKEKKKRIRRKGEKKKGGVGGGGNLMSSRKERGTSFFFKR